MAEGRIRPFFLDCDPVRWITGWVGILANAGLVLWSLAWLWNHLQFAPTALSTWFVCALAALFLADLFSGLVHWGTDTWLDEITWPRVILIAREHHLYPHHIVGYGARDYVAYSSWPSAVVLGPPLLLLTLLVAPGPAVFTAVAILAFIATVMIVGTYAHRLGHRRSDLAVVRWLQKAHLLIDTRHHGVHHGGGHDVRYCVVNGWANHVCDRIGFWRGLEALVSWMTGAVPRANDREWFARFARDRMCLAKAPTAPSAS